MRIRTTQINILGTRLLVEYEPDLDGKLDTIKSVTTEDCIWNFLSEEAKMMIDEKIALELIEEKENKEDEYQ